jgi:hypothetical protein
MREDVRLADRPMEPLECRTCGAHVLVRKSSWDQTSIQWDSTAAAVCLERRALDTELFTGCTALRSSIREAAVTGAIDLPETGVTREELEAAFHLHESTIARAASTGDWEPFVQLFTAEVRYLDPMVGAMHGHEEVRAWVNATLVPFPGSAMTFPASWHVVDPDQSLIVCELRNVLRDPGDGSVHEQSNITVLRYAGDGLFASEQDVYDPAAFIALIEGWGRRAAELGTLTEDEVAWFAATMPAALGDG